MRAVRQLMTKRRIAELIKDMLDRLPVEEMEVQEVTPYHFRVRVPSVNGLPTYYGVKITQEL